MIFDYVEIGTCDFDTEIQKDDGKIGLSVEPIKYYLDKLPNKTGCKKIQAAISSHDQPVKVYFLSLETIEMYKLPLWARGCNTINHVHPGIYHLLKEKGIDIHQVISSYEVPAKTLVSLFTEHHVSGLYYLKIDTEGHDTTILDQFYTSVKSNAYLPHKILFESNVLSKKADVDYIIQSYKRIGYDLIKSDYNTVLKLNLNMLTNKTMFSIEISNYTITQSAQRCIKDSLPYENTLHEAQQYCIEHQGTGVTYQDGIYEVRFGDYIDYTQDSSIKTWVFQ